MTTGTEPKNVLTAWEALLAGSANPVPPSPLDYDDDTQVSRQVEIGGGRWIVLLRAGVDVPEDHP